MRHQRLETPKALPVIEDGRVGHKVGQIGLVVAFEKHRPTPNGILAPKFAELDKINRDINRL